MGHEINFLKQAMSANILRIFGEISAQSVQISALSHRGTSSET